jgi:hypothetical protein
MNALMPQWMTGLLDDFLGAPMDDKPFWTNDFMPPLVMGLLDECFGGLWMMEPSLNPDFFSHSPK